MKKVIVVSKTHLDLGFTDYAENIKNKYLDSFIPSAVDIATKVNGNGKHFVWTTGSWLLREALAGGTEENQKKLIAALKAGDIAPHAMPFTTHTELLDADTLDYGLSMVEEIDRITGRKTIAAKMTDVPGHTIGLVPLLAKHGVKLLHIGVNGASALPDVPDCFVWRQGDSEVIVIYSGDYGGAYQSDLIEEILYFDHTLDNHGASSCDAVLENFDRLRRKYPGYEVVAGRMDDYAELLWQVRDRLPVVTDEIGDTWIHGSAADPYKSAALRTLMRLKAQWLEDGSLTRESPAYQILSDNLLCLAEHTCGMDMKCFFADYEHYLRKDFEKARIKDQVQMHHPFRNFPQNFLTMFSRLTKHYNPGSYQVIEKSWAEQRSYIDAGIAALSPSQRARALSELAKLRPDVLPPLHGDSLDTDRVYTFGEWSLSVNRYGGIQSLRKGAETIICTNEKPVLQYHSYGQADYDYWLKHYTRNLIQTQGWAIGDFARPLLKYADKKYRQGRFSYEMTGGTVQADAHELKITVQLTIDPYCYSQLGAAKEAQLVYTLQEDGLSIALTWINKPASRLTESTIFRLYPNVSQGSLRYLKIGTAVDPMGVVKSGGRNLSAVQNIAFTGDKNAYVVENLHAPLVGLGEGKILQFDNQFPDITADGVSYILHNNVWGTNFPLWYEDNAYFEFKIRRQEHE